MWRLSGLTRRVYLRWRPATHLRDVHVTAEPLQPASSSIASSGVLSLHAQIAYTRRASTPLRVVSPPNGAEGQESEQALSVDVIVHEMPPPPNLSAASATAKAPKVVEEWPAALAGREVSRSTFHVPPRSSSPAINPTLDDPKSISDAFATAHSVIAADPSGHGVSSSAAGGTAALRKRAARALTQLYSSSERGSVYDVQLPSVLVPSPREWSDEAPHLYVVTLVLRRGDSVSADPLEVISIPFGFRSVQISDGVVKLNGQPVLIKGVNRHEHVSAQELAPMLAPPACGPSLTDPSLRCRLVTEKPFPTLSRHLRIRTLGTSSHASRCARTLSP